MPDIHGQASFPGVQAVKSCTYTCSHGITPGVAIMEIAPQPNFAGVGGNLIIQDGVTRLTLTRCKVDKHSFQRTGEGLIWQLAIYDRRWKWQFGSINGTFNLRDDRGGIQPSTERTPQQLAILLLGQMGETRFSVGALPLTARPFVEWQDANPAQELAALCDEFGCRIVFHVATDSVLIARLGVGLPLPINAPIVDDSLSIDPPERPDSILFACGPTRFDYRFALEAVGLDLDATIKPINDLSYKPTVGWEKTYPPYFPAISRTTSETTKKANELARATVFRWYRIRMVNSNFVSAVLEGGGKPLFPGLGEVDDIKRILPIEDERAIVKVETSGKRYNLPAEVTGIDYTGIEQRNTAITAEYKKPFRINKELGIVEFANYVYRHAGSGGGIKPAVMFLRTACSVRDPVSWAWLRHFRQFTFPGPKFATGPLVIKRPDLQATYAFFGADNFGDVNTNQPLVDAEADYYLLAAALQYQTTAPREITYSGIQPISPDGAIAQVEWSIGTPFAITKASRNTEFSFDIPPYGERRHWERHRHNSAGEFAAKVGERILQSVVKKGK